MCGICGIVGPFVGNSENESYVRKMMSRLSHRGPDGRGISHSSNYIFGHTRLAIIDLELGKQPMISDDGKITLVFNGEIYNYIELRQKLIRKGVSFKTFSDTEVLLRLYELEGEDCLKQLNGMFAFAIYDSRANTFFAARDHFGIKPFYYIFLKEGMLAFASEIKAFYEVPFFKAKPNYKGVNEYLTFQFCLGNKTLFENVYKLEPGHKFIWKLDKDSSPMVTSFWNTNFEVDEYHTEEFFTDTLLTLLHDSVTKQIRSDVPVGSYLSGGIDSSIISILGAQKYGNGFQAFTGRFDEGISYDESSFAKAVAEQEGILLHLQTPNSNDFIEYMPKLIYYLDEPVAGPGVFPQFMVSKLASQHVKVVLGGQGADEMFGGYARYVVAYLEQALKGAIFETQEEGKHIVTLSSMINGLPLLKEYIPMLKTFWSDGSFGSMGGRYYKLINRFNDLSNILNKDMLSNYDFNSMFNSYYSIFNRSDTQSYLNKMLHFDQQTLLPSLLQIEDRVSMAVSLESRVPFLDYRIAELANKMPPKLKLKNGIPKNILRETSKNLLPDKIVKRRDKMGFPVPLKEWMIQKKVKDFIMDILTSKSAKERGIFDTSALENKISNESKYGREIWGSLCMELWFQTFIDREGIY